MFSKNRGDDNSEGLYNTTIIGKDLKFNGNIDSMKNVRMDGKMEGNIDCQAKLIIGRTGSVKGEIVTQDAEIYGHIDGKIKVLGLLELRKGADIQGEIFAKNIVSEPGARFNGVCCMDDIDKKTEKKLENENIVEILN